MHKGHLAFRAVALIMMACFLNTILPSAISGQTSGCNYDRNDPSLESARISFKSLNYLCAEEEIEACLQKPDITLEERADAHVLLAAVYYAKVKNEGEKRNRVIEQFKQAFRSYRDWKGELDISSTEFIEMMNEAQKQVDTELRQAEEAAQEKEKEEPVVTPIEPTVNAGTTTAKAAKPWYTKWWAIGLGVGLVAGAVVLASGGGGDGDGGGDGGNEPLPDFPDPPSSKK